MARLLGPLLVEIEGVDVMILVQACLDRLLTGYGYGARCVTAY